jgi:hypothetical protein
MMEFQHLIASIQVLTMHLIEMEESATAESQALKLSEGLADSNPGLLVAPLLPQVVIHCWQATESDDLY